MDIESKRYRIKSEAGGLMATVKGSGRVFSINPADLPNVNALAAMTEAAFDRSVRAAIAQESI